MFLKMMCFKSGTHSGLGLFEVKVLSDLHCRIAVVSCGYDDHGEINEHTVAR